MGRKKTEMDAFREALLSLRDLHDKTREASIMATEAEQRQRQAYAAECKKRDEVMSLWKKIRPEWELHGYVLLPDDRLAVIQPGIVTFSVPVSLKMNKEQTP